MARYSINFEYYDYNGYYNYSMKAFNTFIGAWLYYMFHKHKDYTLLKWYDNKKSKIIKKMVK